MAPDVRPQSRRRIIWLLVGLAVAGAGTAIALRPRKLPKAQTEDVLRRPLRPAADFAVVPLPSDYPGTAVSASHWDGDRYLVCNYNLLQEIDTRTGAVTRISPPTGLSVWNPTGVWASPAEGRVFIANYTGHDVLECSRTGDALALVRRYVHAEMQSPENVALSADGQLVGAADYDGNRLWMFRRDGSLAWERPVPLAHGVAFGPDFVVATSLLDRTVVKYDLAGREQARTGSLGWGDGKYLWPTCVFHQADRLYVTDAHTGRLTALDFDLKPFDWNGGNGPGAGLFNMPYAVAGRARELVVCDTFKDRLLVLDDAFRCQRVLTRDPAPLVWDLPVPAERRNGYTSVSDPCPVELPGVRGRPWYPIYDGYHLGDGRRRGIARFPVSGSLFNQRGFPYFCWCVRRDGYLILGHQVGKSVLVADGRGRACPVDVGEVLWPDGDRFRTNAGRAYDIAPHLAAAARQFAEHDRLLAAGTEPVEAARQSFWPTRSPAEFREAIGRMFISPTGATFWAQWSQDPAAAVRGFDDANVAKEPEELWLQELFLRNILAPR
jgi:hypothetical protein